MEASHLALPPLQDYQNQLLLFEYYSRISDPIQTTAKTHSLNDTALIPPLFFFFSPLQLNHALYPSSMGLGEAGLCSVGSVVVSSFRGWEGMGWIPVLEQGTNPFVS